MKKNRGLFEKDFAEKNRKAMKGISETDEEFVKNNKKAVGKLEKKKDFKKFLGYFLFFITLYYFYLLVTNNVYIDTLKYFSGICIVSGMFFALRLILKGWD